MPPLRGSQVPHQPAVGMTVSQILVVPQGASGPHASFSTRDTDSAAHAQVNITSGVSDGVSSTAGTARVAGTGSLQGYRTTDSNTASALLDLHSVMQLSTMRQMAQRAKRM